MTKVINWLFSKTKLGKWVDGHKTIIGFSLVVLATLVDLSAKATGYFPGIPALADVAQVLQTLSGSLTELLTSVGLGTMVVGVGHKAIKEKEGNG